ncbi:hypothetical protein ABK988_22470 [Vibrio parahaemolyticus]|nr:hypothetical protein [Vibrio parahaemolyticus]
MRPQYKLIIMTAMLSTHAFATIPMSMPTDVILQNLVDSQKQAHQQCIDKANNEKEKKECHSIIEEIKAIEKPIAQTTAKVITCEPNLHSSTYQKETLHASAMLRLQPSNIAQG